MKNPFKKSDNNKTPEGEPLESVGSGAVPGFRKLLIIAAIATFIVIILVISESVVIVQAGHRGVVLYAGVSVVITAANMHDMKAVINTLDIS